MRGRLETRVGFEPTAPGLRGRACVIYRSTTDQNPVGTHRRQIRDVSREVGQRFCSCEGLRIPSGSPDIPLA